MREKRFLYMNYFVFFCTRFRKKNQRSVKPRLVNENLRNFQVPQEGLTVSCVMRGLFAISRHKVFSQDHHSRSGVQATLLSICILN